MGHKIIKITGTLLLLCILFPLPSKGAIKGEILTLKEAQALALENSPALRLLELEYEEKGYTASVAGKALEEARREIRDINYALQDLARQERDIRRELGDQDLDPAHLAIYRQELRLIEQHAGGLKEAMDKIVESRSDLHYQYELEKAAQDEVRHRLEDKHLLLAREVERKYYTILELDKAHDSLQKSLDYLLKQQDSENKRVSLGLSTPLSLQRLGAQVENTAYLWHTSSTLCRLARQDFNNLLGRSLDSPLFLEEKIVPRGELPAYPGSGTAFLEQCKGLKGLRAYIETEKNRATDLKDRYSMGTPEYLATAKRLEKLQLELEEAKQALLLGISNAYHQVRDAQANLRAREAENKLAQRELYLGQKKKDLGLMGNLDLLKLQNQARQAEVNLLKATAAYNLSVTDYELARRGVLVN